MTIRLALLEDHVSPGKPLAQDAAVRAIYVRRGRASVSAPGGGRALAEDECGLFDGAIEIVGDGELWTFELRAQASEPLVAEPDQARVILAVSLALDPRAPLVFRADRIDYPAGGVTPKHGHRGPGIRRLLHGRLFAEIGGQCGRLEAPDAWFETGHDPVVGRNLAATSAFVRAMVLPADLKGQPSFMPWTPEEAKKARGVTPRGFFDEVVTVTP